MTTRVIISGLLGGIVMFIWTSIAHMFLPLGEIGIKEIPNETSVLGSLQDNIRGRTGLYVFPGLGLGENAGKQERNEAMKHLSEKYASKPSGILMYHPPGRPFEIGRRLGIEFGTEFAEALLAVFLLAQTAIGSFLGRVTFVFVAGILAAVATNVSYWNWYGFPARYTAAYMFIQIVGFLLVGIVAAMMLGKRQTQTA
jgi:hypothetical protein